MGKPRNAEEQAFWDAVALAVIPALAALATGRMIGAYGVKEAAGDAYEFATALLAERQRMTDAST